MRNIVLVIIGCSLASTVHTESREHLNDLGTKDKQIFMDLASVRLADMNILWGNQKHDIFEVSIRIKKELPTDKFGLIRNDNSYYIKKYYVNCYDESIALQAKELYTENDEKFMTYVHIEEYVNKKEKSGGDF